MTLSESHWALLERIAFASDENRGLLRGEKEQFAALLDAGYIFRLTVSQAIHPSQAGWHATATGRDALKHYKRQQLASKNLQVGSLMRVRNDNDTVCEVVEILNDGNVMVRFGVGSKPIQVSATELEPLVPFGGRLEAASEAQFVMNIVKARTKKMERLTANGEILQAYELALKNIEALCDVVTLLLTGGDDD